MDLDLWFSNILGVKLCYGFFIMKNIVYMIKNIFYVYFFVASCRVRILSFLKIPLPVSVSAPVSIFVSVSMLLSCMNDGSFNFFYALPY